MLSYIKNISFVNDWLLGLLLLVPVLIWWAFFRQRQIFPEIQMSNLKAFKGNSLRGKLRNILPFLRVLSFIFLVIALARPQLELKEENITAEGIDIMLSIDLSSSMLAQDFKPDRLEVSKKVAAEFVSKREYDRLGLVIFAGGSFTQCPLTTDHAVMREFLGQIQCGFLDDGTAIGMGLATAVNRLKESEAESKVIILLTDGVNNAGYIQPITAAEIAEQLGVKVYTIGVGSTGDALTPIGRRADGQYIFGFSRVEIDEDLLIEIAQMTGGKYFRATSAEALQQIYNEIDRLEKTEIETTSFRRYSEEFHYFAFLGILFIILEILLRYTVFKTIP